jgi:hypothetical protein
MTMTSPPPDGHGGETTPGGRKRMSTVVKVGLMGAGAAALLYSCGPSIGSGLSTLPMLWFFSNPFYRPPIAAPPCPPGAPGCTPQQATTPGGTTSTGSSLSPRTGTRGTTTTTPDSSRSTTPPSSTRGGFGSTAGGGSSGS